MRLERARCITARLLIPLGFRFLSTALRLLPRSHPVRIFLDDRLTTLLPIVKKGTVPASKQHAHSELMMTLLVIGGAVAPIISGATALALL